MELRSSMNVTDDDDNDSRAKRQEMIMYSDFISNLPENVIDQILIRLPITDAVRTSVLSTNWRYKWTTLTQLVFRDELFLPSPRDLTQLVFHDITQPLFRDELILRSAHDNSKDKLIYFIDRVLLLHSGFIHKFELFNTCLPISSPLIDAWILFLSRKNITELVLKLQHYLPAIKRNEKYMLPTCFFSAQKITTLELHWCILELPPPTTFTGFSNLKSLHLGNTTFVDKSGFECLISKCPLLERLTLTCCILGLDSLNICSPNLKYLRLLFDGFQDICFENTPLLSDVSIGLKCSNITDQTVFRSKTENVIKLLSSLPCLKKFEMNESFLKFLGLSKIPENLPFTCYHLDNLNMQLNFEDVNAMCVTLCLLNSAPNLRKLEITTYSVSKPGQDIKNFWEKRTHIDWKMSRLQVVKITNYNVFELKSGLEFIKLLLANSPMLEMLSIRPWKKGFQRLELMEPGKEDMLLLFQLLRFERASPKAVIEFPGFV